MELLAQRFGGGEAPVFLGMELRVYCVLALARAVQRFAQPDSCSGYACKTLMGAFNSENCSCVSENVNLAEDKSIEA